MLLDESDIDMNNPLLDHSGLPRFADIRPEHAGPAVDELLATANAALERATSDAVPADYDALSAVLDVATENLGRAWGAVSHLNAVADSPALRAAYTGNLPKITEFHTRLGADERLFAKYRAVMAAPAAQHLGRARRRALENALRDFKLSGAELVGEAKERFSRVLETQAELSQKYAEHVLDATDGYALFVTEDELAGVPADAVQAARAAAAADGKEGHKLTLHFPSYFPVMQYGDNRALRETLYTAYATRASDIGPAALDNSAVMRELLELRQEEAALLGLASYAELSLVPKMADSPKQVIDFLRDLARRARPSAERDLAELREFARTELGIAELQAWDMPYASEKLKEKRYAFSEQEVKQYFTEPKVLEGLFRIIETLFEVSIRPDTAQVWHDSVRFYRIERSVSGNGAGGAAPQLVGQFYLDPYARSGKRPGAWMDDVRGRWKRPEGAVQTPVAHLVCNFAPPLDGQPALLTHDDVTTLFHEFGHGLHHMLTQVDDIGVAGISASRGTRSSCPASSWRTSAGSGTCSSTSPRTCRRASRCRARSLTACSQQRTSRAGCRRCARSSLRCATCACTARPMQPAASRRLPKRCAPRSPWFGRRRSTATCTASRTSLQAVTRPATTATNGLRCSRPMPGAHSRKRAPPATSSTSQPAAATARTCSRLAEAAARWTTSKRSEAANRASTRCCAIKAWRDVACGGLR